MKDRTGKELMVKNHCVFCYNTIYNPDPLSLSGQKRPIRRLNPAALRLQFVKETKEEMEAVIKAYAREYAVSEEDLDSCALKRPGREAGTASGKNNPRQFHLQGDFTRGHFKRGVE